jgi:hypothetical protein
MTLDIAPRVNRRRLPGAGRREANLFERRRMIERA